MPFRTGPFQPGKGMFSRIFISFPAGNTPFSRKISLFPGKQLIFPEKQFVSRKTASFFREICQFPGKHVILPENRPISIRIKSVLPGKWLISRETAPFFRETGFFPGESYRFSGKTICFLLAIFFFHTEMSPFPGKQS